MKKLLAIGLAVLGLASAPNNAYTQECFGCPCETVSGMYMGVYAGPTWWLDTFASLSGGEFQEHQIDSGYHVGGVLGYRMCSGIRLELDLGWRDNGIDRLHLHDSAGSGLSEPTLSTSSDLRALSYLGNVIFECVWEMCDCCLRPFFGFGAGAATVYHQAHYSGFDVDDNETVFAYQLIIGLAYPMCDGCMDLAIEYRRFSTADLTLTTAGSGELHFRDYLHSHNLVVSLKTMIGNLW